MFEEGGGRGGVYPRGGAYLKVLAKGGAYSGEGAYLRVGAYSRRYGITL